MPQYAEAVSGQNLSSEAVYELTPGLTAEASASALLIAKRQAILERIAIEKETRPKIKIDWREHLREAEVTLNEAQQKLATYVLAKEDVISQKREATSATLFLRWFSAEGMTVQELNASRRSLISPMYKAIRELTPEVINPTLEPDYSINPAIIQELSNPISRVPNSSHDNAHRTSPLSASDPLAWQTDALCAETDPEAFFPEHGESTRDAKRICTSCDVKTQCLEYALENDERFGVWGGLSEHERRRLQYRRSI